MANYTIIGGDEKEYGPVTAEEIRIWISEGRLAAYSKVRSDADMNWRPLGQFPEFAADLQPRQNPPPLAALPTRQPASGDRAAALEAIKFPALCLMVAAGISLMISLFCVGQILFFPTKMEDQMAEINKLMQTLGLPNSAAGMDPSQLQNYFKLATYLTLGGYLLGLLISSVILVGANKMKQLTNHEFAMVAVILSLIPCLTPCLAYLLLLPFGIWSLVTLRQPGVKAHFQ